MEPTDSLNTAFMLQLQRDLGLALGSTSRIEEAMDQVVLAFMQIEGIDCGGGYLVDEQTGDLNLVAHEGVSESFLEIASYFAADSPQVRMIEQGEPIYQPYLQVVPNLDDVRAREQLRAIAILPVRFKGRVIAALNLASRTVDDFLIEVRLMLETTAALVGGAIARVRAETAVSKSQQKLQTLFDLLEDFLFILDENGRILQVNPIVEKRLGYSIEELRGQPVLFVHPPERHDEAVTIISGMLKGEEANCSIPLLTKTGEEIPVDTIVTAGEWGTKPVLIGISRDVTVREQARKALQQSHDELEQRIKQRTANLRETNHQLMQEIIERKRAEKALKQNQRLLSAFFSQSLDGCFFMMLDEPVAWDDTIDREDVMDYVFEHQRITAVNDAMLAQYGSNRDDFIGLTPQDFFAHDIDHGRETWFKFFDNGRLRIETNEQKADGTSMNIEGDYVCLFDDQGRITGHFGIQRDITQRKEAKQQLLKAQQALQESQRMLTTLMNNLPGMAYRCMCDPAWTMAFVNIGCLPLTGYQQDDLINNKKVTYGDLIHPDDREMVWQEVNSAIEANQPFQINYRIITRSGQVKWVWEQGIKVGKTEDGTPFLEGFITDVNERKLAEDKLEHYANELEQRVTERTQELTEANKRLKELDQLKSKFISDVTHELRTPVTNLVMYLDLLEKGKPEKSDHYRSVLQEEAARLKTLVESTLDLSRLDFKKESVKFSPFGLNQIVTQGIDTQQRHADSKSLSLEFMPGENLPPVLGDAQLVSRILQNLLVNAVMYTHEGGVIVMTRFDTAVNQILLRVQDTGIGMSEVEQEHCFDPFYRGERVGQLNLPGNGLGLTLVKEIVTLHNGLISLTSTIDKGSTFSVWLPITDE